MRLLQTIILCFVFSSLFCQSKTLYNIVSTNGDTTFWYKYQRKVSDKIHLPSLDTSSNIEYYRIWTDKQVIDIYKNQDGSYSGRLTTWTDEYISSNEEQINRVFSKSISLSSDTSQILKDIFKSSNMQNLPTDDSISGWKQGFDGITYIIEHSTKNYYSFKSYWTPKSQDSLKEAIQVQNFFDIAFSVVDAQNIWKEFSKTIPYECYINGGPSVTCKILTKKERKKYVKERKSYKRYNITKN